MTRRSRRAPIREAERSIRGEMIGPRHTAVASGRLPFVAKPPPLPATRTAEPPPREEDPPPHKVGRAAPASARALPRRRGEIAEDANTNPRSKLAELRSKIASLQEQLEIAQAGGGSVGGSGDTEATADAIAFIDAALAGVHSSMPPGKPRESVVRLLERAKECLS